MHDVIVIGGGHNGLTTAALLAKRGRRVVVLEQRDVVGGLGAGTEFHPGYTSPGVLHDTSGVRQSVVRELELEKHGLRMRSTRPDVLALGDPTPLRIAGGAAGAANEIAQRSPRDADRCLEYTRFLERVREPLLAFLDEAPVDFTATESLGAWDLLRRGIRARPRSKADMLELLRVPPMCVADWLNEWFESDLLKAALSLPAVAGNFAGPWSPGTAANLLFHEAAAGPGVQGNAAALVAALHGTCDAHGVEVRTGARVRRLIVDAGRVRGVVLDSGEDLQANTVAASCDPKTLFLKLVPPGSCSARLLHRITHYRCTGTTAQVLFGLDRPPRCGDATFEFARTGAHVDEIERAFDAIKYNRVAPQPILDIHLPTVASPSLAPAGHAVMSVLVHFVPYALDGGWTAAARDRLAATVERLIDAHVDGFASSVVARHVLAPPDIERDYGVTGGDIHHGEHAIDQRLMRPAPECTGYTTPIAGLFLCGSGTHPGGGLTCAPGAMAARAIIEQT